MITDLKVCPMCQSKKIKINVWRSTQTHSGPTRKILDSYGIGCIKELVCGKCGYKHTEN